jgi:hypothetical protein
MKFPIPTNIDFKIEQFAIDMSVSIRQVVEFYETGVLNFAVVASHYQPRRKFTLRRVDPAGNVIGPHLPLPEHLYFNAEGNEWLEISECDGRFEIETFFDLTTGDAYHLFFHGEPYAATADFAALRVTQEEINRLNLTPNFQSPSQSVVNTIGSQDHAGSVLAGSIPNTRTKNFYLKTIFALSEALVDGFTGKRATDGELVVKALEEFYHKKLAEISPANQAAYKPRSPVTSRTLDEYFSKVDDLDYDFLDFRNELPKS